MTAASPSSLLSRARRSLLVIAVGFATGVLTLLGQAIFDGDWNRLLNSGAIWVTVAFALGAVMHSDREAAVAGTAALVLALVGYHLAASACRAPLGSSAFVIWTGTAIVGGPVFGIAGRRWRATQDDRASSPSRPRRRLRGRRGLHLVGRPGPLARGLDRGRPRDRAAAPPGRDRRERATALALLVPLAVLGLLAYGVIDRLFLLADRGSEVRPPQLTAVADLTPLRALQLAQRTPGHVQAAARHRGRAAPGDRPRARAVVRCDVGTPCSLKLANNRGRDAHTLVEGP